MRYKVTYETVELLDTDKYSTYIQVQTLSHIYIYIYIYIYICILDTDK